MVSPKNEREAKGQGSSRGGLPTKIHAAVDANGQPVRFFIARGQQSYFTKAVDQSDRFSASYVVGGKGDDADYIVEAIESKGGEAVSNRQAATTLTH